METEELQRTWPRQTFGQGSDYRQPADCAPPTAGTAIIIFSMGGLGFVLLGAKTWSRTFGRIVPITLSIVVLASGLLAEGTNHDRSDQASSPPNGGRGSSGLFGLPQIT
jgi:hypothetical protein